MAARVIVHTDEPPIGTIRPELYGHFAEHLGACVDEGIWVGVDSKIPNINGMRSDVIEALRRLAVPVLRWPGGCFADDYHWEDGIGPREARPRRVNAWWGHTIDPNHFGTHEFIAFCRLIGAQPYLAGNVGSGTPRELKQWVEYCNFNGDSTLAGRRAANGSPHPFDVRYWGIGNENWGCGGNFDPEDYAAAYKQFSTFVSTFARPPLNMPLFLVACGPNGNNHDWTRRFFTKAGMPRQDWQLHGFAAHYYCGTAGTATQFNTDQWYELIHRAAGIEKLILEQRMIMDEFDPHRLIGLIIDEWGTWHPPTPHRVPQHLWQQNTLRDALVAAITLDTFNRHADKLVMCNIAQLINVLQAMILTQGERMLLTPTFHVFEMYKTHQGGASLRMTIETETTRFATQGRSETLPVLSGSASRKSGELTITITNAHSTLPAEITLDLRGFGPAIGSVVTLTSDDLAVHNTFDEPEQIVPTHRPIELATEATYRCPAASVTTVRLRRG
jgi:alpha-N-arabinofuranosidase